MKSVFVAGSRALSKLNAQVRERLDNIMQQNLAVFVGDANGADKAVQQYLAKSHYQNVVVYAMESCRNNLGAWPTRLHAGKEGARRDRHYYGIKDKAMAEDASCGFMLWDGASKGTLTNIVNLLNTKKKALLYLSPKKTFLTLNSFADLERALQANGIDNIAGLLSSLGMPEIESQTFF
jgi:hypothetical protein